ncbi:hypothetical protein [Polaromonas sp. SM01]|uniref:hypothetical protein n=1 Tax=Polaromonas sp. SM01 TaxID=3085630 RepID=UPI0039903B44
MGTALAAALRKPRHHDVLGRNATRLFVGDHGHYGHYGRLRLTQPDFILTMHPSTKMETARSSPA